MRYYASSQTILHRGEGGAGGELFQNTGTLVMMDKCNFPLSFPINSFGVFGASKATHIKANRQIKASTAAHLSVFSIISHNAPQEGAGDVMDRCGRTDRGGKKNTFNLQLQ